MDKIYRYRIKGSSSLRKLAMQAKAVNFVWNFCNDSQKAAVRWGRRWLTGYDLNALTDGSGQDLDLGAQTVQAIGQQYALSRKTHKKRWLRYRGIRSLGWVPFKATGIKQIADGFKFRGHVYRVWLSRPVPGRIKCGSFAQDAVGHWYINLCVDVPIATTCGPGKVGIDLGLKTTATMSDGSKFDGVRAYRANEPKLAIAQRARKKQRVKALHAQAKNRRLDGLHKLTTQLVRENKSVAVGNVSSTKLAKTKMAKSVYDAGWGMLRQFLRYKTLASGAEYVEVDESYSSQRCSHCGTLPESRPRGIAALEIREWTCSNCGTGHDRDINAARNILALGSERPAEGIPVL
jgi:IS605 OrfB family transposase